MKKCNLLNLKILTLLLFLISTSAFAQRFEVEKGVLTNGAEVVTDATVSGGSYVNLKGGAIAVTINIAQTGFYNFYLNVSSPFGDKTNIFDIDGSSVNFSLKQSSTYQSIEVVFGTKLTQGNHIISIKNSWGWINIDYFEVEKVDPVNRFTNLSDTLVTPNSTNEAKRLFQFMSDNYGKKIISGVMTLGSMDEVNWLFQNTGKKPALVGIDFMHVNRGYTWYNNDEPTNDALNYYNSNGIPAFCWHWRDPSRKTEAFYTADTDFDVRKIFDKNSAEYNAMIQDIDFVSAKLKKLQDQKVAILWRPLHESGGGWFWWGAHGGAACVELWHVMYDRMVNYHGIKNMIWVWTGTASEKTTFYPGDKYVDVVGIDYYSEGNHLSQINEFNILNRAYPTKLVTITECGSFPDPDNLVADQAAWSYYMPWYGNYVRQSKNNSLDLWKKTFNHDYVLTQDEMPNLRTYTSPVTSSKIISAEDLNVFPTLVTDHFTIQSKNAIGEIRIFNLSGTMVKSLTESQHQAVVSIDSLPSGMYLVKTDENKSFKVIKK